MSQTRKLLVVGSCMTLFAMSVAQAADVAKVNGKNITDRDLKNVLSGFNEGQRKNVLKDPTSRRQILNNLVEQELLVQQGEKEKLDQDQDYKDAIAAFRRQYLASKVLQKNLGSKLNDQAAKKFYSAHKSNFSTDQVHVHHILLGDEAAAKDTLNKAKAPNADFQAMAEKISKDPSAKNNRGDVGMITRDSPFVKEFKEAAFSAAEGEIIGPVKTPYGFHVIKVVQKKLGRPLEYDEVELRVKDELRQELIEQFVSKLRQQAKISVDDQVLEKIN